MPSQNSPRNIPWKCQIIPINTQIEATTRLAEETKLLKGKIRRTLAQPKRR